MYTAHKVAELAAEWGQDLVTVGIPKAIDSDAGAGLMAAGASKLIDHTPGYWSVPRHRALTVQSTDKDNPGSCPADPVLAKQAMGRRIGFIPAAVRLADPQREMSLPIILILPGSCHHYITSILILPSQLLRQTTLRRRRPLPAPTSHTSNRRQIRALTKSISVVS